ncbi:SDR family oxidoreductase [Noviherbaspirillum denitrificans]|uniref:NAD-dependent dehydratase n=1 Tax=Noviherbaspirillum denitrificans TaxID=1968433 RepID=A0A254T643_9BURK|nr:SDR family oxidoreductase [Noviherbaspirillum denitrificans]OWW18159.1 NAD-dependent dehydratase [Noviherbaspirillum denitrificans]
MAKRKALIAGGTGVVGRNLLKHLVDTGEWEIVVLSRRKPDVPGEYEHVAVDLLDAENCRQQLGHLTGITHIFFAAYVDRPELTDWVESNVRLLRNLVEAVEANATDLEHIHLVHGTKWYGNHLGPFKTPAKEGDARHMPPNFYYDQWDYLVERQKGKQWTYSSVRPHAICGFALGNPMNLTMVIAVYAAISKELGLPLSHPGSPGNFHALYQCTDSRLLARAIVWMSTNESCANEAFNITNGDLIRWENTWPRIADYFHMEVGPRRQLSLVKYMADKGPIWDRIVSRYGLRKVPYEQIVSWAYGDFVFTPEFDIISDMGKARRFGFHESVDTEEMFFGLWDQFRAAGIIPAA